VELPGSGLVEVDGGRLWYEARGDGPTVVLVHSSLVDSRMWDRQMDTFSRSFLVVRYDARGFGRSTAPEAAYSHPDDLLALLDGMGIEWAALVGCSMGGAISVEVPLAHPDRVSALIPVASGLFRYSGWSDRMRSLWEEMDPLVAAGDIERAQEIELDAWVPRAGLPGDDDIWRIAEENRKVFLIDEDLEEWPSDVPAEDRIAEIAVPTLAVVGDRDIPEMLAIADLIRDRVPGARKVLIERADHLPNMRNPEAFDVAVLGFLEEVL